MTADQLVASLARCRKRNAELRAHNHKLWESAQEWKRKNEKRRVENNRMRTKIRDLIVSRDLWRSRAEHPRAVGAAPWHNITLSERDVQRILEMPPR